VIRRLSTIAILALAGVVGCAGTEDDGIKLVKVTGTITADGKPLAGVRVSFLPAIGSPSFAPATGESGSDGSYTLYCKNRPGAAPGKYKVTIAPADNAPVVLSEDDIRKNDPVRLEFERKAALKNKRSPVKKAAPSAPKDGESEFEAEIKDADGQVLNFDTKDAKRPAKT
jgi:hypothetical protein